MQSVGTESATISLSRGNIDKSFFLTLLIQYTKQALSAIIELTASIIVIFCPWESQIIGVIYGKKYLLGKQDISKNYYHRFQNTANNY